VDSTSRKLQAYDHYPYSLFICIFKPTTMAAPVPSPSPPLCPSHSQRRACLPHLFRVQRRGGGRRRQGGADRRRRESEQIGIEVEYERQTAEAAPALHRRGGHSRTRPPSLPRAALGRRPSPPSSSAPPRPSPSYLPRAASRWRPPASRWSGAASARIGADQHRSGVREADSGDRARPLFSSACGAGAWGGGRAAFVFFSAGPHCQIHRRRGECGVR
jgi:hypothetical protein